MRGPGPVTILSLCCASEREEPGSAPVTQLLIALVLSLELTPSTCCRSVSPIACLLCGMSSARLLQPKWTNANPLSGCFFSVQKLLRLLSGYVTLSRYTFQLCTCYSARDILMFNPTLSDFILWLWRPDVRFSVLIWSYIERVLGKCIPLLHWQQM